MTGFAALMALSASQTKEAQSAVQTALEQRHRNEELKRKKQEEDERKRREEEAKIRQKRFEDQKKEQELEAKRATEEARRAGEAMRREEEARQVLLYGPKKARLQQGVRWPTSTSGIPEDVRLGRLGDGDDDDLRSGSPALGLTREEKRQRKVEAELRRTYQLKRSSTAGYTKAGRRLPGGAIDKQSGPTSDRGSTQSVKARLTALPNTLTKLNVNKRDTRTIDEILQDRAKAKNATLDGDEAREFNDWFGKSKKKDKEPASQSQSQLSTTLASAPSSGANSPRPVGTKAVSQSQPVPVHGKTASHTSGTRSASLHARPTLSAKSSSTTIPKLASSAAKSARSKSPVPKSHPARSGSASGAGAPPRPGGIPLKKRPRSPSTWLSPSPPPPKRRASEHEQSLGSEIWKLFGKNRSSYVAKDVWSDDEDMEADADDVMKEELRSARLAKREDEIALEEEKRHEEDKRRRKREREMRERQGM